MKKNIVFNTNYSGASTVALMDNLIQKLRSIGYNVTKNDWNNYHKYDTALFMSPDSQVLKAKKKNPNIITGIMDPKIPKERLTEVKNADFTVVTSLEQRNALLPYNKNPFIYLSLPDRPAIPKQHKKKEKIIIGYHGNKEHLMCINPHISNALKKLAQEIDIEFWAIYNINSLGKWKLGTPKNITIKHIQWHENVYAQELAKCDIGIANNAIPSNKTLTNIAARYLIKRPRILGYPYRKDDYIYRAKYSTNPGRIYEFALLGIPVVADYYPSASQVITDGISGYIVHEEESWYWALKKLALSHTIRQKMSEKLLKTFQEKFSTENTFKKFTEFMENIRTNNELS